MAVRVCFRSNVHTSLAYLTVRGSEVLSKFQLAAGRKWRQT